MWIKDNLVDDGLPRRPCIDTTTVRHAPVPPTPQADGIPKARAMAAVAALAALIHAFLEKGSRLAQAGVGVVFVRSGGGDLFHGVGEWWQCIPRS